MRKRILWLFAVMVLAAAQQANAQAIGEKFASGPTEVTISNNFVGPTGPELEAAALQAAMVETSMLVTAMEQTGWTGVQVIWWPAEHWYPNWPNLLTGVGSIDWEIWGVPPEPDPGGEGG